MARRNNRCGDRRGRPRGRQLDPALRAINNHPQFPVMLVARSSPITRRFTIGPGSTEFSQVIANSREDEVQAALDNPNNLTPYRPRRRRRRHRHRRQPGELPYVVQPNRHFTCVFCQQPGRSYFLIPFHIDCYFQCVHYYIPLFTPL